MLDFIYAVISRICNNNIYLPQVLFPLGEKSFYASISGMLFQNFLVEWGNKIFLKIILSTTEE